MNKEKPPDEPRGKLLKIDLPFEDALRAALEVKTPKKNRPTKKKGRPP